MRYRASEKLEIIRIVERSHLPTKVRLDKLGISRPTFYRRYERFHRTLQSPQIPRELEKPYACRRLLREGADHSKSKGKAQTKHSIYGACNTAKLPHNINSKMSQSLS